MTRRTHPQYLLFLSILLLPSALAAGPMNKTAPTLPAPRGNVVRVSSVAELEQAVVSLTSNTTILVEPGDYPLTRPLVIDKGDSVALRGASGVRSDVVIHGLGMTVSPEEGNIPILISIYDVYDVLIADITLSGAWYHNLHLAGDRGPVRAHIYNVHSLDCGEQHLKVNPGFEPVLFPDSGLVEFCRFEFTDRAKHWYTNGVDVLDGAGWTIRDCEFVHIRGPVGVLAGGAVLLWRNSYGSLVERNLFYECDFGVVLGLNAGVGNSKREPSATWDHTGGIVRNNVIYRKESGDVGISVNMARDFKIYHNTVILNNTFLWNIEYRWDNSSGEVFNNLTDGAVLSRDGATARSGGNLLSAKPSWFADFANADLHLAESASEVIGKALAADMVTDDYDGDRRPVEGSPDIGADEYIPPTAPGDLDADGRVDIFDLLRLLKALSSRETTRAMDLDGDGNVDIFDLLRLLRLLAG